jgi:hypothetical protein
VASKFTGEPSFHKRLLSNIPRLMEEVDCLLCEGKIHPITPVFTFDASELEQALLYFSKGHHIGKIVVTYENPTATVKVCLLTYHTLGYE